MSVPDKLTDILDGRSMLQQAEPGIISATSLANEYDTVFGSFYDVIACSAFYNRIFWGYHIAALGSFCTDALSASPDGWVLDAGCGSLAFSAKSYIGIGRPVVFLDQSARMLRIARSRLERLHGCIPANMFFVQGDIRHLPFKSESFDTVISLNLLHVCPDLPGVLGDLKLTAKAGADLSFTTLIENNRYADAYLRRLGRSGYVIPRTGDQLLAAFQNVGLVAECLIMGNMAFIQSRRGKE